MEINKRGVFFSIDALIALSIILFVIVISYPFISNNGPKNQVQYDVLTTFSSLKAYETNNVYLQSLITQGVVTETNKSLLEVIGDLYVTNKTIAQQLGNSLLADLDTQENIGMWYENTLIASKNTSSYEQASSVDTARQTISGIKGEQNASGVTGFAARAYLTNKVQTKYVYFGGYVGDGNISVNIDLNGSIRNVSMEAAINSNFTLYVNNVSGGLFAQSPSSTSPGNYTLPVSAFRNGTNVIEFKGSNISIAGGFIKIVYQSEAQYEQPTRYYFPGINGIINLYDGIYVPGQINSMNAYLHYVSNYTTILAIGNTTVYNGSSSTPANVTLSNAQLVTLINYNSLSNTTTPLRLGLQNISFVGSGFSDIDVVLITDVSGSMDWRLDSDVSGTTRNCNDASLYSSSTKRISLAKCLDISFVSTILNNNTNARVALVSFSDNADAYVNLTRNQTLLNNTIGAYATGGSTCVSCAINRAYAILQNQSNVTRLKFIVAMTDGVANRRSTATCNDLSGQGAINSTFPWSGGTGLLLKKLSNSWVSQVTPTSVQINDIEFTNATFGLAAGASGLLMRWNGTTWFNVTSPVSSDINGIDVYNTTFALAAGASGRVLKWNGTGWSILATISNSPTLYGASIVNSTTLYVSGVRSNSGRIYKSTNAGGSWSQDYQSGSIFRDVKNVNASLGFAVGDGGEMARLSGTSWSAISSPTSQDLYRIDVYNASRVSAVGGNNGNSLILGYNGASWSTEMNSVGDSLRDVNNFNSIRYASGEGATIYTYNGAWSQVYDVPIAYRGNSSTGVTCTADDDSCSLTNSFPSLNANYSSCRAHIDLNATIYSIGFGPIETCDFARQTLQSIATCGNGTFYASSNATTLQQFYANIAQSILQIAFSEQTSQIVGNISTILYPDSYIEFNYTKTQFPYGLFITTEKYFTNTTRGSFVTPLNATNVEARVVSYSGSKWTNLVRANNISIYNLTRYGQSYLSLGDPYQIQIPLSAINTSNIVDLTTGTAPQNTSIGSLSNKIISTVLKNASGYSPIAALAEGCRWTIEFDAGGNLTTRIPSTYNGSEQCSYTSSSVAYNSNDVMQEAVYRLLKELDLDSNNKVDITLNPEDIDISLTQLTGIPYTWSTEVQVRLWR